MAASKLQTARRRKHSSIERQQKKWFLIFISPAIIGFLVFTLYPLFFSLALSFSRYDLFSPMKFIGFKNYVRMFSADRYLPLSIGITFKFALISVPINLVAAFAVALLMNTKVKGIFFYRTLWYSPAVVPVIAGSVLWLGIFNFRYGILNRALEAVGVAGPNWLWDEQWVLFAFVIMGLWSIGGSMIIYLAALQGVPKELYESADMDGASRLAKTFKITIPMVSPIIFFNVTMAVMGIMGYFGPAFVLTRGGPNNATLFYALYVYRAALSLQRWGYAAALSWLSAAISLILTMLVFRSSPMWVFYETLKKEK